ncbi:uncharacterized protein JCM10292_003394 [Rhodotorula paludigena]|uniref:uncharacterized protein n=1 Tax=Rhodotorula paludigena TaxID=86838 RepID=UPI00317383B2
MPPPRSPSTALPDVASLSLSSFPSAAPAPPPYQAVPPLAAAPPPSRGPRTSRTGAPPPQRRSSVEDRLAPLGRYDLTLVVDDSPSMVDYWDETRSALMGVVEKCTKYDKDGIDVLFLNAEERRMANVTDPALVERAFREVEPQGSTPTGMVLDELLREYVERVEDAKQTRERVKPLLVLVLTDGRADDPDMVKDIIVEMAQRLDEVRAPPYQLGIQFVQIGSDPDARAFLQELDDDLKPQLGVRDMVDCTPFEGEITPDFILKAALGAVVRSIDG